MNMQELSVRELSERMADPTAFLAGGSASALSAAFAAALTSLCAGLAVRHGQAQMASVAEEAQALRRELLQDVQRDAESFDAYLQARRDQAPAGHIADALRAATAVPLGIAGRSLRLLQLLDELRPFCPRSVVADAQTARLLSLAAARATLMTARVNIRMLPQPEAAAALTQDLQQLEQALQRHREARQHAE